MTSEQKQILLEDLCARLPYKVKVRVFMHRNDPTSEETLILNGYDGSSRYKFWIYDGKKLAKYGVCGQGFNICDIKPYLRPMSSMTKEEEVELNRNLSELCYRISWSSFCSADIYASNVDVRPTEMAFIQKFMDSHFFDWRGLIPMDLALPAREGMYDIKETNI